MLYVNPAFSELTGYAAEEVLGRTPGEILRSDAHGPEFYAEIDRETRAGRVWKGRIVSRHKSGSLIHQEATISPIFGESGELTYFVAAKRDVSDRIRAEAALQASEARFLAAAGSIPDGLVILDADDRIAFYNNRHPELLPPALREVPGTRNPLRGLDPRRAGAWPRLPSGHGAGLCGSGGSHRATSP